MDLDIYTDPGEEVEEDDLDFLDGDQDIDEDQAGFENGTPRADQGQFSGVDLITPRRCFKGARNVETVKDCRFLQESYG